MVAGPRFRLPTSLALMRNPDAAYARWRERYGPTFLARAVNGDVWITGDPACIRDLFRANDDQVEPFKPEVFAPLLGPNSVFALKGDAHRRERKLLMPPFHGPRMRAYGQLIQQATLDELSRWRLGERVVLSDALLEVSLTVIVRAVFGVQAPEERTRWSALLRDTIDAFDPLVLFVPQLQHRWVPAWRRFDDARTALHDAMARHIQTARQAPAGEDILSLLLASTYDDGTSMTDEAVRDELVSLLFAGHETTQISMAWALYRLHERPETLHRLRAELDDAPDDAPDTLAKLPYLSAVVDETLRIDPIVPDVIRTLSQPMTLGERTLPAGAHVAPVAALVHRDPALYPEPERFEPQRFLDRRYRPWEFLPFGGGTRRCVGAALATYEMKIVVGTLLRRVVLALDGPDRLIRRTITLAPRRGVPARVQAWRDAPTLVGTDSV